jgi:hypothetical protein
VCEGVFYFFAASERVFDPNNKIMFKDVATCRSYELVEPPFADYSISTGGDGFVIRGTVDGARLIALSVSRSDTTRISAMARKCPRARGER